MRQTCPQLKVPLPDSSFLIISSAPLLSFRSQLKYLFFQDHSVQIRYLLHYSPSLHPVYFGHGLCTVRGYLVHLFTWRPLSSPRMSPHESMFPVFFYLIEFCFKFQEISSTLYSHTSNTFFKFWLYF